MTTLRIYFLFFWVAVLLAPAGAVADSRTDPAAWLRGLDTFSVAAPGGELIYSQKAATMIVPASVLKILTALVAFEHLGPAYRFHTDFYVDQYGSLIIKGHGDPFLLSENVAAIAGRLANKVSSVNNLIMDGSYFDDVVIPGTRAVSTRSYDAPVSALSVNFNTVFFSTRNGEIVSAESQTPLLPLAKARIQSLGISSGRVMLTSDKNETTQYAGELFRYFLESSGVPVRGSIFPDTVETKGLTHLYRYYSEMDVSEMAHQMLEFSNNFVANQLFLASGAEAYGAPATLEKGVRAAEAYAATLGIAAEIAEGSGISRENRISPEMMMRVLDAFAPYSGLLQKRGRVYYKTGTLAGIQTRAGYIEGKDGIFYRFMVTLNTWERPVDPLVDRLAGEL